ncbi:MAG: hypothetical protein ACPGNT_00915 [Rhodospirillales bacterium]
MPRRKTPASRARSLLAELNGTPEKLAAGYRAFMAEPPPTDAKGFAAHHSAAKAALSHLDQVVRLMVEAEAMATGQEASEADAESLIAKARAALADTSLDA